MGVGRRILFSAAATVLGILVGVVLAEIAARAAGHQPWQYVGVDPRVPIMFEADDVLGWRPKVGRFELPPSDWAGPPRVTIHPDRARATGAPPDQQPELVLIGCSFTFGWGVSDDETFAARLQQRHPEWKVMNLGVPGYSGYQSLLRLEQLLATGRRPKRVLYGYIQSHELRNIAHPFWTYSLEKYSTQGMVAVPYPTLDANGALLRHPPERYPAWPLRHVLALVPLMEQQWAIVARSTRTNDYTAVADRVFLDMWQLSRAHRFELGMVLLRADAGWKRHYARLLGARNIRLIDCALPASSDLIIPNDGHPNARGHRRYAECIERSLTARPDGYD